MMILSKKVFSKLKGVVEGKPFIFAYAYQP